MKEEGPQKKNPEKVRQDKIKKITSQLRSKFLTQEETEHLVSYGTGSGLNLAN